MALASKRDDGRGHWPAGRHRHQDAGDWQRIIRAVALLLTDHPRHGIRSRRALAAAVGIAEGSTVGRWLSRGHRPSEDDQRRVAAWLDGQLADLIASARGSDRPTRRLVALALGVPRATVDAWVAGGRIPRRTPHLALLAAWARRSPRDR